MAVKSQANKVGFTAVPASKGRFLLHGVEEFVEKFIERKLKESRVEERIAELRRALKLPTKTKVAPAPKVSAPKAAPAPQASAPKAVPAPKVSAPKAVPAPKASAPKAVPAPKSSAPKAAKPAKKAAKKATPKTAPAATPDAMNGLLEAFSAHPKKAALLKAGKQKDQLLRALIPLYVGQKLELEISSGVTSKFWAKHGVTFAAPNAAKALREHTGHSKRTANGVQITAAGIAYVEAALKP